MTVGQHNVMSSYFLSISLSPFCLSHSVTHIHMANVLYFQTFNTFIGHTIHNIIYFIRFTSARYLYLMYVNFCYLTTRVNNTNVVAFASCMFHNDIRAPIYYLRVTQCDTQYMHALRWASTHKYTQAPDIDAKRVQCACIRLSAVQFYGIGKTCATMSCYIIYTCVYVQATNTTNGAHLIDRGVLSKT